MTFQHQHDKVYINIPGKWDPDLIPVEEWFASTFVMLEVLTKETKTQIAGLTMLLDCEGFSFKHIRLEAEDKARRLLI